jgi:hypothetical protein
MVLTFPYVLQYSAPSNGCMLRVLPSHVALCPRAVEARYSVPAACRTEDVNPAGASAAAPYAVKQAAVGSDTVRYCQRVIWLEQRLQ